MSTVWSEYRKPANVVWLAISGMAVLLLAAEVASGQSVISAKSGMVSLVDGAAFVNNVQIQDKVGANPELRENQVLRTTDGRVEMLLNPGVFLRLGERSAVRMLRNRLEDTRIAFVDGMAVIEAAEVTKDVSVTVEYRDATITLKKAGIYRFDSAPGRLRVFAGAARVELGKRTMEVGAGKMVAFEGEISGVIVKFNKELTDALDRWSRRRGEQIAAANISSAKSLKDGGYTIYSGLWRWNPYFGMYTYIPARGSVMSPYGYRYWSPGAVGRVFYAPPSRTPSDSYSSSGWGNSGMSATSSGYSGTAASVNSGDSGSYSSPAASSSGSAAAASAGGSVVGGGASGGGGRGR
jgi:hypothetical protein